MLFSPSSFAARWTWLHRLWPAALSTTPQERLRAVAGLGLGVWATAWASHWLVGSAGLWLVAPIGASALLVFAAPYSPLAQPWSVVGGNTLSAWVGVACVVLIPDPTLAGAVAVVLAFAVMTALRCLHPPGGAVALLVVLSQGHAWSFALFPVFTNSLLLVLVGVLYNSWTGHPYPHQQVASSLASEDAGEVSRFTRADLDTALAHYNQVLDVSPDDLIDLLRHAESAAYQRTLGELRCQDIMTPNPTAVEFGTTLREAWDLMRRLNIKALPVIDKARRVVGIVTVADFLRHARLDEHTGLAGRLQSMLKPTGLVETEQAEVVGQIMTRQVRVASASRHAVDLLPLFSAAGHHHLPIIDERQRLVGILTQTDLVKTLSRAVLRH
jgi:CBS domain-containing membrane protein